MSAIIETHTRGQFTVLDTPKDARLVLRARSLVGEPALFVTPDGQLIEIYYTDVKRIRRRGEHRPWARKAAAIAALILIVTPCYIAGVTAMSLGGYAILSELAGNGADINIPGWAVFPGLAAWYVGGAIGTLAADTLGI